MPDKKEFVVTSPTIPQNSNISAEHYLNCFGCSGQNKRPVLSWKNAPAETKSFAVTFYDQDAPTGSGFWHWVVYDIPSTISTIAESSIPDGALEANTDFGESGYFGPCPPVGRKHRYTFYVHALDQETLDIPVNATAPLAGFFIHQHSLAKTSYTVVAGPRIENV